MKLWIRSFRIGALALGLVLLQPQAAHATLIGQQLTFACDGCALGVNPDGSLIFGTRTWALEPTDSLGPELTLNAWDVDVESSSIKYTVLTDSITFFNPLKWIIQGIAGGFTSAVVDGSSNHPYVGLSFDQTSVTLDMSGEQGQDGKFILIRLERAIAVTEPGSLALILVAVAAGFGSRLRRV